MNNNLTDITLIVDRSGSMQSIKLEAQNGINHFIEEQKKLEGEALFTLIEFDTEYKVVYNAVPIKEVEKYFLVPRGMTALLDAVGNAINNTGVRLSNMEEEDRPALVIMAIITDGEENSSKEFTRPSIKKMITEQTDKYNWQFTFLGANQDAFKEASSIGISYSATAGFVGQSVGYAYGGLSNNISGMRTARMKGQAITNTYTDDDRAKMVS